MKEIGAFISSTVGTIKLVQNGDSISTIHFMDDAATDVDTNVSTPLLQECALQLAAYFKGTLNHFTFPMAQSGTDFQQRVWTQLQAIAFGKTINYNQLAIQLGDAKCIRAAGTANGRNNIAIIVPCHRVIGSDGSLTGYAGGLWRKQWLLEHEAKFAHGVQMLF